MNSWGAFVFDGVPHMGFFNVQLLYWTRASKWDDAKCP